MSTIRLLFLTLIASALVACTTARQNTVMQPKPEAVGPATCAMISPTVDYNPYRPVPGVVYIEVINNSPKGRKVGYGGTWGPQDHDQVVLFFRIFAQKGPGCHTPEVLDLVMKVEPKSFIIGRAFQVQGTRKGIDEGVTYNSGNVSYDGIIQIKFWSPLQLPVDGLTLTLRLDTRGAQHGDMLAVTSGSVDYQVGNEQFRSYQPSYTPPPLTY